MKSLFRTPFTSDAGARRALRVAGASLAAVGMALVAIGTAGIPLSAGAARLTSTAPIARGTQTNAVAATAVTGSAFGVSAPNISLFGGSQTPYGPTPTVTLPAGGSATPVTASDASEGVVFGPATLFSSGQVSVSTQGTLAGGQVTSDDSVQPANQISGTCPGTETSCIYVGPFTANTVANTCTAGATLSGGPTITNGSLVTATDTAGTPTTTMPIPTNPSANDTVDGYLWISSSDKETFAFVFNQQVTNSDGSVTFTAVHEEFFGPTATGDLYIGQATCGVTPATSTTTSSSTSSASSTSRSSSTSSSSSTTSSSSTSSSASTSTAGSSSGTTTESSSTTTSAAVVGSANPGVPTTGGDVEVGAGLGLLAAGAGLVALAGRVGRRR